VQTNIAAPIVRYRSDNMIIIRTLIHSKITVTLKNVLWGVSWNTCERVKNCNLLGW